MRPDLPASGRLDEPHAFPGLPPDRACARTPCPRLEQRPPLQSLKQAARLPRKTLMNAEKLPPHPIPRTGDDRPVRDLMGYVRRMSGWRQLGLFALALLATALGLAPVELQRRLIDDAIAQGDMALLTRLGAIYAGVILAHQAVKFALRLGQARLGESVALYTRRHLLELRARGAAGDAERPGEAAPILTAETEKLGGFVGVAPSSAFADMAMLIGVLGYMLWIEPAGAAIALALIAPQIVSAPVMQRRLNRLVERRVVLNRGFGDLVSATAQPPQERTDEALTELYGNQIALHVWKQIAKATLNLLNGAAPLAMLALGGAMVIGGQTSLGVLVAFVSAFERLSDPIRTLLGFYRQCAQAGVQHRKIAEWMQPPAAAGDAEPARPDA